MDRRGLNSVLGTLFLLGGLAIAGDSSARADAIYTYTGNPYNDFRNGGACPPTCNLTGFFDLAVPLLDNLPLTLITPVSFSITSGLITVTGGEPTDTALYVGTDEFGAINAWSWEVVGPADSPDARLLTEGGVGAGTVADDLRVGTDPPPFVGPVVALIQNDPGTWKESTSTVPEPNGIAAVAVGMLSILGLVRGRRRLRL